MNKKIIFLDLDDTLAATSKQIEKQFDYSYFCINDNPLKKNWRGFLHDINTWHNIKNQPQFWQEIPVLTSAHLLYQQCKQITPHIKVLTALPLIVYPFKGQAFQKAAIQKKSWVRQHLSSIEEVIVCYAKEKPLYVSSDLSILIDDNLKNITKWKLRGGLGIHWKNPQIVEQQLRFIEQFSGNNAQLHHEFNQNWYSV